MPVNVKSFCTSVLFILIGLALVVSVRAQQAAEAPIPQASASPMAPTPQPPTAGEVMRERISKAKAYLAVRNYPAAIYELENIRRETNDPSVNSVAVVLLMNGYLEQGDYKRARDFLETFFKSYKSKNPNAAVLYTGVAGQIVKGARNQIDRYRALGLMVSERNLPLEAVNDIEQMRVTLELVITQAKEMSVEKERSGAMMPLIEEAVAARSALGRDDYDARRWRDEIADTREQLVNSQSVIMNAVPNTSAETAVAQNTSAESPAPPAVPASTPNQAETKPTSDVKPKASGTTPAVSVEKPAAEQPVRFVGKPGNDNSKPSPTRNLNDRTPVEFGSLITYAAKQSPPVYPPAARNMRTSGVVRVEIIVDEDGEVAEIQKATGPALLQTAAKDAIKKWKFRPFTRDGRSVRASGFVNFNFSL